MYRDDFLMRQIRRLAEALARLARGERVPAAELDDAAREAVGLDLDALDRLPVEALLALIVPSDDRSVERIRVIAELLAAIAVDGPEGEGRRGKARALLAGVDAARSR